MFDLGPAGRPDAEEGHPMPEFAHPCHGASIHSPAKRLATTQPDVTLQDLVSSSKWGKLDVMRDA